MVQPHKQLWSCWLPLFAPVQSLLSVHVWQRVRHTSCCLRTFSFAFSSQDLSGAIFKAMFTRGYSNGKSGAKLANRIHQICQSNVSGAMRCCSVYRLFEFRSCQFAYLVQRLQFSHELLGVCIGLKIQWLLSLLVKSQVLAKVLALDKWLVAITWLQNHTASWWLPFNLVLHRSSEAGFSIEGGTRRLIAAYFGICSRLLCV